MTAPVLGRRRVAVAVMIMVAADVGAVYSMAVHVAWGWHLLGLSLVFVALARWVRRDVMRLPLAAILAITGVVQLTGLLVFPLTSDDIYRYVWDGRVQWAGIDPYRYVPLDHALDGLRDSWLFPPGGRPLINRPGVPTIYPPGAQLWFALIGWLTPPALVLGLLRIGAAAAVVATTAVIGSFLGPHRGRALLYGANPLVMVEAANGGHLDALVALGLSGLVWFAVRRRFWLAGLCLGLAASIKLVPLILLPVFVHRGRWRTSLVAAALPLAGYVPHLVVAGSLVLGYLPGYWQEEGYGGSRRFALLIMVPEQLRTGAALAVALALAIVAVLRSAKEPVAVTCCWLLGAAFLVATPVYPWYALPLVVLAIMAERLEWLAVWPAIYLSFLFDRRLEVQAVAYGTALLVVLITAYRRRARRTSASVDVAASDVIVS